MKTSSMTYWYNYDHNCISLIYDDTWDPDVLLWWWMWSTVHEIIYPHWEMFERIDWYLRDEIWICMHDMCQASPKLFTLIWPCFFLHSYKCDDVGYIQWCMMIPSIRTHYFDTHGTYATWDYIIQYKYENVVDDILI